MKRGLFTFIVCCSTAVSFSATAQIENLKTGEQAELNGTTTTKAFAGSTVNLSNFSGVFGMSSDTAYIVTAAGNASIGGLKAKPGEVLILTPYGGEPAKQIFDASRFLATLSADKTAMNSNVMVGLRKIEKRQNRAKFFGLYQSTNFNIAAPGSSSNELARRTVVGSKVIQNIRFSSETDPKAIERQVVAAFRDALINGDADAVASLMDPTPYGGTDLRGGASGARLLRAKQLMKSKNWARLLSNAKIKPVRADNMWLFSQGNNRVVVQLRPIGDFTYISSIKQEA